VADEYAKCECALCHRRVPKNHAVSQEIERESGRSSGFRFGSRSASSYGTTYYRKQTIWICEECYPAFKAAQERQALTRGAAWIVAIGAGVWIFSNHGSTVSNAPPSDTTASIAKQDLVRPSDTATAARYSVAPNVPPAATVPRPSSPTLEAQNMLVKLGYDVGGADGKMGPKTRAALSRFATMEHLYFDGGISSHILSTLRVRAKASDETLATLRSQAKGQ
jgi:hypothetical protein